MPPPWSLALVTGASSGIGLALATALARDGTNLVIVARDVPRLEALAAELRDGFGVQVEVLPADLCDPAGLAEVEDRVGARPTVDLLVNNAGFGTSGEFHLLALDQETREVQLNVIALMRLTHAALPGMVDRGIGTILNISSMAAFQPIANTATYGATKAFVLSFSEAVHEEVRTKGVKVTCVCPGFTRTEFQNRAGLEETARALPDFMWQSAEDCAAEALTAAGAGKALVVPGSLNKVVATSTALVPRGLKRRALGTISRRAGV